MQLKIGQVFYDKDHAFTDGSNNINCIHILLSVDKEKGKLIYRTMQFMWTSQGYAGTERIRRFNESELSLLHRVGTIEQIINFYEKP